MGSPRPTVPQWIWYAYSGRLPERLREWVLRDATVRTWVLRHLARTLAQWVPSLLLLLLPGPWALRLSLPLLVLLGAVYVSLSYLEETSEQRLLRHGFPPGTGTAMRRARTDLDSLDP